MSGKRILVKDIYAELLVLTERVDNLRVDFRDLSVRVTNLEDRINKAINNEIEHLRKEIKNSRVKTDGWTRKDKEFIGGLITVVYVLARLLEFVITKGFPY